MPLVELWAFVLVSLLATLQNGLWGKLNMASMGAVQGIATDLAKKVNTMLKRVWANSAQLMSCNERQHNFWDIGYAIVKHCFVIIIFLNK